MTCETEVRGNLAQVSHKANGGTSEVIRGSNLF